MTSIDISYEDRLSTRCVQKENGAVIVTDAPKDNQGRGEMFSPTDLLAASLGSCILTVMGLMAERLKVDIKGLKASVEKEMLTKPRRIGKIVVRVSCPNDFSSEIKAQLEKAGAECPVHHSLHPEMTQQILFTWGCR